MTTIKTRRELVLLMDYKDCNPQGDPDRDNAPRTDPETNHGLITAPGIKRKLRDRFQIAGHQIYVSRGACFETTNRALAQGAGLTVFGTGEEERKAEKADKTEKAEKKTPKQRREEADSFFATLCSTYVDVRMFGQLIPQLSNSPRGPVQVSMARSVEPVQPMRAAITRVAVATEKEEQAQGGGNRMMGAQWYIPYGLYRAHIFVNPNDALRTGFSEKDYELLVWGLTEMFEYDRSSARTGACVRGLYEFRHKDIHSGPASGMVNGERLLEGILVRRTCSPQEAKDVPARHFSDYEVGVPRSYFTSTDFEFRELIKPVADSTEVNWSRQHQEPAHAAVPAAPIGTAE